MVISLLEHFVVGQLFTFLMLVCRIGSCLMMMPAIGDVYVMPRIRLLLACAISVLITPLMADHMPPVPGSPISMFIMVAAEIIIGAFFGTLVRIIMSVMNVAGTIIANQSSLAIASIFEATAGVQTAIVSNFFTIGAIALFFALNLHHIVLAAIVNSYSVFPTGQFFVVGDASSVIARHIADAFLLGVQFAAPHIVMSLVFYLAAGIMSRMMPSFQVFFVLMPPQVMLALGLLIIIIAPMMTIYSQFLEEHLLELTSSIGGTDG